jgi:hypothetical protein
MKTLKHRFVQLIPDQIEEGVLYISVDYKIGIHKCPCGCGNEVVTPISPTDWQLFYNGDSISLYPSIGNWNFKCRSHYWIVENQIKAARKYSNLEINQSRKMNAKLKASYYKKLSPDDIPYT